MKYYLKRNWKKITIMCIMIIFFSFCTLYAQKLKGTVLDTALTGKMNDVISVVILLGFFILAANVTEIIYIYIRINISQSICCDIRNRIFQSVIFSPKFKIKDIEEAEVLARYTTDLKQVETEFINMGGMLLANFITIIVTAAGLISIDPVTGLISLALFMLPVLAAKYFETRVSITQKNFLEGNGKHVDLVMGHMSGLEAIKNYHIEKNISKIYLHSLKMLKKLDMERAKAKSAGNGASFMVTCLLQAIIVVLTGLKLYKGQITSGEFISFFALVSILKAPMYWVSKMYQSVVSSIPAIKRISELTGSESEELSQTDFDGLEVKNLSFGYDEKNILENISFNVKKGEKIFISGASGSGKSTLTDIILGYLSKAAGDISPDPSRYDSSGIYSVARQDAFVFNDTLRENLRLYDKTISDMEIEKMMNDVGLERMLSEKTLDGVLLSGGSDISGGEKKRISLARAMLRKTPVLILDEPLANIDSENIDRIEDLILSIEDRAVILISHQMSGRLRSGMDKIIRLNGGGGDEKTLEEK